MIVLTEASITNILKDIATHEQAKIRACKKLDDFARIVARDYCKLIGEVFGQYNDLNWCPGLISLDNVKFVKFGDSSSQLDDHPLPPFSKDDKFLTVSYCGNWREAYPIEFSIPAMYVWDRQAWITTCRMFFDDIENYQELVQEQQEVRHREHIRAEAERLGMVVLE